MSAARRKASPKAKQAYLDGQRRKAQRDAARRRGEVESVPLVERLLAIGALVSVVLAVIAYLTTIFISSYSENVRLERGAWDAVILVAYVGLPLGFIMMMALLFLSMRRRGRAASHRAGTARR